MSKQQDPAGAEPMPRSLSRRLEPEDVSPVIVDPLRDLLAAGPAASAPSSGPSPQPLNDKALIQSVNRALDILEILGQQPQALRLQEIAARCGLNASTCHHLLNTLAYRGYVCRHDQERTYQLGAQLFELMKSHGGHFDLVSEALPEIRRLSLELKETIVLAAFSGSSLVILTRQDPPDIAQAPQPNLDLVAAAHATAVGKAMLAWLPEPQIARVVADRGLTPFTDKTIDSLATLVESLRQVRRHGFALEDEEFLPGRVGVACAVRGRSGEVLGAIGCLLPAYRAGAPYLAQIQPILAGGVDALSRRFAASGREADGSVWR